MDHVNKTLLLSLKQDLQSLNESIESFNNRDIKSWLFPTKNYQFVREYIEEKNIFEVNNVKILLELIIDRLYVGIRLILASIQDDLKDDDVDNYLILQPQQVTIGCCFENLRHTLSLFKQKMEDNTSTINTSDILSVDGLITPKKHGKTQTDLSSMNKCDSCASAMSCMRNLLKIFDVHKEDIYQTEHIQSRIYDLTQFGCMIQTTISLENSLKDLLTKLLDKDNENKDLNKSIKALTMDIQKKNGKIILLENETTALNEKNKKNSTEMAQLQLRINHLIMCLAKSESQIEALTNSNNTLSSTVSICRTESKILLKEKRSLCEYLANSKKLTNQLIGKLPALEINLVKIENDYRVLLDEFGNLNIGLDNLVKTLGTVTKIQNGLENKIKLLYCDSADNATNFAKDFKSFQERIQQLLLQSHINDVKSEESVPKIEIKGNPVEDITRQIEDNNERIRLLHIENLKLENILSKFKNIKK